MVTNDADGAPEAALRPPVAPMVPEPFAPDELTPLKLMTVIEELTLCESVAVAVTLLRGVAAKVRQISEVPLWPLVRTTSDHVRPPPEMPVTVVFVPLT